MTSSLTWNYGEDDTFDIPVAWEADTRTLTLTGVSGQEGRTTPIVAKKSES